MKNIVNSVRVAPENWLDEKRFDTLLSLLKKYDCAIGQIALFSSSSHTPLTFDQMEYRVSVMEKRMEAVRKAGFSAGINLLGTLGHHDENLENCYKSEANRLTNIHGDVAMGVFCPRDQRYIDGYLKPVYTMLAKSGAEFIWIDDDVRYYHMPVGIGCFCDDCVAKFNKKFGHSFTRESLRAAFNKPDMTVRREWLKFNGDAICHLFEEIAKTVRAVSDKIILGFMTGERYFESYDFRAFAEALSEKGKYEIMWRPGGLAYTDESVYEFLFKAREIGRQIHDLPDYVTVIQSEIENHPYQLIKKTPFSTAMESLFYMTFGCTGAAFNILPSYTGEPIENCERHLIAISKAVDQYRKLHDQLYGMKPVGIGSGWRRDCFIYNRGHEWTESSLVDCANYAQELYTFGLPECCGDTNIVAQTMNKATASMMTDEELLKALSGGVYMDAEALDHINSRGFGEYTGFECEKTVPVDALERYLDTPLNGICRNGTRNCRQAFHYGLSVAIRPTNEKAVKLSSLVGYEDEPKADCSMGIFENSLGGRIAVCGYYPFTWISDYFKAYQLTEVFKYISKNTLPAYIDSYHRMCTTVLKKDERTCVCLFNFTPDTVEKVGLVIKTDKKQLTFSCGNDSVVINGSEIGDGYTRFVIDEMIPWQIAVAEL
ncbi:MAG: hypothetical protein IKL81_03705 [Clostridia bacterium]|nr:hypothetical protein [Clostridia bacterium]